MTRSAVLALLIALGALALNAAEPRSEIDVLIRAAAQAESQGNLQEAWATYDRALELARAAGEPAAQGRVLRHRGITALHQQDIEQGVQDLTESVRLFESAGQPVEAAKSRLHLVPALDGRGDTERADEEMQTATQALVGSDDESTLYFAEIVEARRLIARARPREALPRLEKAADYYERSGKSGRLADALSLKAYALQQLGEWEPAKKAYRALLDVAFRSGDQAQIAYAYCNLAEVERNLGSPQIAGELLDRSIELLDRMRAGVVGGPEERIAFLDTQVDAYHRRIALLVDAGKPLDALALVERFQARAFLESIEEPPPDAPAPTSALEASTRTLMALQRKLLRAGLAESETQALRSEEERWTTLAKESRRDRANVASPLRPVGLEELQRRIPPRTAFLRYWVHPRGTLLWVVRARGTDLIQVPIAADELESAVRRYVDPLRDRTLAQDIALRKGAAGHIAAGAELFRLLVAPALRLLGDVDALIVVPDASLCYLPFEALVAARPDPWPDTPPDAPFFWEYSKLRFLVDDYRIHYVPSTTAWVRLMQAGTDGEGFVSLAPFPQGDSSLDRGRRLPVLPSARSESAALAALFASGEALLGAEASEPRAEKALARARYVHFSAHGYLHRERSDLSGIYLWDSEPQAGRKAPADDGLLQAHEVRGLRVRSELVSLAVCNSALGQFSRAEGLLGMGRAFLTSGARNVVVSLWPAHDAASALLMQVLYEEVARGRPPSAALQTAKRRLRSEVRTGTVVLGNEKLSYAHPYFWSGYIQIGAD